MAAIIAAIMAAIMAAHDFVIAVINVWQSELLWKMEAPDESIFSFLKMEPFLKEPVSVLHGNRSAKSYSIHL